MGKAPSTYVIRDADGDVVASLTHELRGSGDMFAVYAVNSDHQRQRLSDIAVAFVSKACRHAQVEIVECDNIVLVIKIRKGETFKGLSNKVRSAIADELSGADYALFESHDPSTAFALPGSIRLGDFD